MVGGSNPPFGTNFKRERFFGSALFFFYVKRVADDARSFKEVCRGLKWFTDKFQFAGMREPR